MEEQRSIFHANGVPLKYSIHRVTRACPPSSCRVHSSAFFFFLFFFPLRGKKIVSYLRQGKANPLISLTSSLESPRDSWSRASRVTVTDRSSFVIELVLPRRVITRDGGSSNLTCEVSLPLYFAGTRRILSSRFEFTRYTNEVTYNIRADFQINVSPSIIKSWR